MSDSHPSNNPIVKTLQVLLSGTGYNFYDLKNRTRADDLLVRENASNLITSSCHHLTTLDAEYRHRFIPPSTRETPYPPAAEMEKLRAIGRLRERLSGVETGIRGMSVPTQDKVWWRIRQEQGLLNALIQFDSQLVHLSSALAGQVQAITADDWHGRSIPDELDSPIQALQQTAREREAFLRMPLAY